MVNYIDDDQVQHNLDYASAIALVRESFADLDNERAVNQVRLRSNIDSVVLNVMLAIAPKYHLMVVKSYPVVSQTSTRGSELKLLIYSMNSGRIVSLMKAAVLGQIRTGASTAVATGLLARPDSEILTIFG